MGGDWRRDDSGTKAKTVGAAATRTSKRVDDEYLFTIIGKKSYNRAGSVVVDTSQVVPS